MHHYKIVLPEHLNDYGFLFGGNLLKWVDEIAYIRVSLDLPERKFVTVGLGIKSKKVKSCVFNANKPE
jgi:acyl-CoA hydrolase